MIAGRLAECVRSSSQNGFTEVPVGTTPVPPDDPEAALLRRVSASVRLALAGRGRPARRSAHAPPLCSEEEVVEVVVVEAAGLDREAPARRRRDLCREHSILRRCQPIRGS